MAESAKVLNPAKTVLLPNLSAGCSLADSISAESLEDWKERYPGHAVVTYVNSTAEVKALSDICCTSANAASVVRSLPEKKILFTPDRNLGAWVKSKVPEKEVVVYDGGCPIHDVLRSASVEKVHGGAPERGGHRPPGVPRRRAGAGRRGLLHHRDDRRRGPPPGGEDLHRGHRARHPDRPAGSAIRTRSSSSPTAAWAAACTART